MLGAMTRTLVDAERLLELLNGPTDINDKPGAPDLVVSDGEIEFGMYVLFLLPFGDRLSTVSDNVSSTYDGR
jgi:ATP-binding cassette subfamily B (MDR/TAP) protein 6